MGSLPKEHQSECMGSRITLLKRGGSRRGRRTERFDGPPRQDQIDSKLLPAYIRYSPLSHGQRARYLAHEAVDHPEALAAEESDALTPAAHSCPGGLPVAPACLQRHRP